MKAFLICPVRGADPAVSRRYVEQLEASGWTVHWPHRDTEQADPDGLAICQQNRAAIVAADHVFIIWDGRSTGCLFDMGMAFALGKPVTILDAPPPDVPPGKSFLRMIRAWGASSQEKEDPPWPI
jgi:nucleoside 2-deoxyribosyltransferase